MHDLVIRGGRFVDGTGAPARRADVGVDDGRVVAIGDVDAGKTTIDADDRVVAPGFVDVHTHLDVQGFWDPALTPSCFHGVTTVLGGNCGFTVAPLSDDAGEYLVRMLAKVEGMPLESLEHGVPWGTWRTTGEYLDLLDGRLALNAGFMVGHSALRRVVMGEEATARAATEDEISRMATLLRDGLAAGGLGFSSTWSATHIDAAGRPVPSRHADVHELVTLAAVCGEFAGTSLEFLPAVGRFPDEAVEVMIAMSETAQRPLNWNIITPSARSLPHWLDKLAVGDQARARGAKVVGLVIPDAPPARFSFRSGFVLDSIPGWEGPLALPVPERLRFLQDPAGRAQLAARAAAAAPTSALARFGEKVVVETFSASTKRYEGRIVADIAAEEGKEPLDALLDIVCADDLRTSFCNLVPAATHEDWQARATIWRDPRAVVGASDAGAHLDMLTTFTFATTLLEEGVRKRPLLTLEHAVHLLTEVPARLYGLRDRGRLQDGARADIVIFDDATVGRGPVYTRTDLPAGAARLSSDAIGVDHVIVNGVPVVADGTLTGAAPGTLLRSGRDTETPALI